MLPISLVGNCCWLICFSAWRKSAYRRSDLSFNCATSCFVFNCSFGQIYWSIVQRCASFSTGRLLFAQIDWSDCTTSRFLFNCSFGQIDWLIVQTTRFLFKCSCPSILVVHPRSSSVKQQTSPMPQYHGNLRSHSSCGSIHHWQVHFFSGQISCFDNVVSNLDGSSFGRSFFGPKKCHSEHRNIMEVLGVVWFDSLSISLSIPHWYGNLWSRLVLRLIIDKFLPVSVPIFSVSAVLCQPGCLFLSFCQFFIRTTFFNLDGSLFGLPFFIQETPPTPGTLQHPCEWGAVRRSTMSHEVTYVYFLFIYYLSKLHAWLMKVALFSCYRC